MMKRIILFCSMLLAFAMVEAQYGNEWIDYNKTYYKFKVGQTGLYRIPQTALQGIGLGSIPAEQFQLWRNGQQVSLYISKATGVLAAADFIEFWGEMNDGKADNALYRSPELQLSDKWSLQTDTAAFFLTVNPSGGNARLVDAVNDVANNTLSPEPYFIHKEAVHYRNRIHYGKAEIITEYVYSSSYDIGEGWASEYIYPGAGLTTTLNDLRVYNAGPAASLYLAASGNTQFNRKISAVVNGTEVLNVAMNKFTDTKQTVSVPLTLITSGVANINFKNLADTANDQYLVSNFSLSYPRTWDFNNAKNFEFNLPATATGNYLEITNFNSGSVAPLLYDLNNGKRYTAVISGGTLRFALPASSVNRRLVLVNAESSNIQLVSTFTVRNFINYAESGKQGDYWIISHPVLFSDGNPVEEYRSYRASSAGGGFTSRIYDINELEDQFAYGIKKHPLSVRNFVQYGLAQFALKPRYVVLIGRGIDYVSYLYTQNLPQGDRLNLIPSFGYPASDVLLAAKSSSALSDVNIGRISAVNAAEVRIYLDKVKQYEQVQKSPSQTIEAKAWTKTILHAIGGSNSFLQNTIIGYMRNAGRIISDTSYGGNISTYATGAVGSIGQFNSQDIERLFAEGIGLLSYFGHSSSSTLEFNIDDPYAYDNEGKYPMFIVNGCNAGNIFYYDEVRLNQLTTLSERYTFANKRGGIGFLASTHFGVVSYLNTYIQNLYAAMSRSKYGQPIGEIMREAGKGLINFYGESSYLARLHVEEINLNGDPAISMYSWGKPDYAIEESGLRVTPSFISVAESSFRLDLKYFNLGRAISDSLMVEVKRQLPDGSTVVLFREKINGIRFSDSLRLNVPINPLVDKGINKIFVTLDPDGLSDEISETNNTVSKEFQIVEDEARPIYPFNFSIVNKSAIKFVATTANPISDVKQYVMEIDTTELFNSAFKKTQTISSGGGIIEFSPSITFTDSTVYYWRTAPVPTPGDTYKWANASFVYLSQSSPGWNQSHYYQQLKDEYIKLHLKPDRNLEFDPEQNQVRISSTVYPYGQNACYYNEGLMFSGGCGSYLNSLEFVVVDERRGYVYPNDNPAGRWGALSATCPDNGVYKPAIFDFYYNQPSWRKRAADFLDSVPAGSQVYMLNWGSVGYLSDPDFVNEWMNDTLTWGSQSLYSKLKAIGLDRIDEFTQNLPFIFGFKKELNGSWSVFEQKYGAAVEETISGTYAVQSFDKEGTVFSTVIGPSRKWKSIHWNTRQLEANSKDSIKIKVYGLGLDYRESLLFTFNDLRKDTTIEFIDAAKYPYMRLEMNNKDDKDYTPAQPRYWQVKYEPVPEGAVAPSIFLKVKDTLMRGEPMNLQVAFKNISDAAFDSLKIKFIVTDQNNVQHVIIPPKRRPLPAGDSLIVNYPIDTRNFVGKNTLYLDVNPDNDQLEQYHFNNYIYKDFFVKDDTYKPVMDVTFDGVRILNQDIVASKPHVMIKLNDDNKFIPLDDTSQIRLQVVYPNGQTRTFNFNNDTLRFTPANTTAGQENTATIDFYPFFSEDGEYELIVTGKDYSGNAAGINAYRVKFQVINKAMISNLLNYPNPFTTETAFVFTITGAEVPQEFKIQILTVTGKIVREITRQELGTLHIGRNITEYKWDGTDQFGQKLANGVYLYRVITSMNGKSLEKYNGNGNTDQYFNKGYGKMVLIR